MDEIQGGLSAVERDMLVMGDTTPSPMVAHKAVFFMGD
jgi:hypothetical protein